MATQLKLAQILPDHEEMFKRIYSRPGVAGMMVVSSEGQVLYSSFDPQVSNQLRVYGLQFCMCSYDAIKDIDPKNQLNYVRLKSQRREIIIIPGDKYFIMVTCFADTNFHQ